MADKDSDASKRNKAIKLLEQFERLAEKFGIDIPQRTLQRLRKLRDSGTIQSGNLPAKLVREFPGEFTGTSLEQLRRGKTT